MSDPLVEITPEDQAQLRQGERYLKSALAPVFRQPIDRVLGYVLGDEDEIMGIFTSDGDPYQFTITADDRISYHQLRFAPPKEVKGSRTDGVQIKKKCINSTPCGESCIPKGAICRQGLPKVSQARTAAVRVILKTSRKLARAASTVAIAAGVTAIAAYATKKLDTPQMRKRINKAMKSVDLPKEQVQRIQDFASRIASEAGYKQIGEAIAPRGSLFTPHRPLTRTEKLKLKVKLAVDDYVNAWKYAPGPTAMQHLSVGVLLISAEQIGEQLGYIPKGTLMNTLGADRMKERMSRPAQPKSQPYRVNTRKTNYGA